METEEVQVYNCTIYDCDEKEYRLMTNWQWFWYRCYVIVRNIWKVINNQKQVEPKGSERWM
jgi:hypothetical protein